MGSDVCVTSMRGTSRNDCSARGERELHVLQRRMSQPSDAHRVRFDTQAEHTLEFLKHQFPRNVSRE